MLNIDEKHRASGMTLFRMGFRPFFLGAAIYSVLSVSAWMMTTTFDMSLVSEEWPPVIWHAHEMLFGYAVAVVAGFLLTAIRNWTGEQTIRGPWLLLLFTLWMTARVIPLIDIDHSIKLMAVFDVLFMLVFITVAAIPVIKVKQFSQMGILSKLVLLLISNLLFYLGALGLVADGVRWGLYSGLYMLIALVLVMARRVIPFFIEKGTNKGVVVRNWKWVDVTSLVLLLLLWICDVFTVYDLLVSLIAILLFVVHIIRMTGWHTVDIWNRPLLWVLYLAYASIVSGFLLKSLEYWLAISPFLSVHAFAYGGIGLMTLGMMSRVILGHTGRNILEPPPVLFWCFVLLLAGTVVRVVFPLFNNDLYVYWISLSQILWIASFVVFLVVYTPMLITPRIDGRDG
jgi:uncharacterized protein involved in response to NO